MPITYEGPEFSRSYAVDLWHAHLVDALTLNRWSRIVDSICVLVLHGPGPPAWRTNLNPVWTPLGTTTLVRIVQNITAPSETGTPTEWVEISSPHHEVLHFDLATTDLELQLAAERFIVRMHQGKGRKYGVWRAKDGTKNAMRIRIPHA